MRTPAEQTLIFSKLFTGTKPNPPDPNFPKENQFDHKRNEYSIYQPMHR